MSLYFSQPMCIARACCGALVMQLRLNSQQVAFVVPYKDGSEATKYWRWVQEIKPPLPKGFRGRFHMAAILLKVGHSLHNGTDWSSSCTLRQTAELPSKSLPGANLPQEIKATANQVCATYLIVIAHKMVCNLFR